MAREIFRSSTRTRRSTPEASFVSTNKSIIVPPRIEFNCFSDSPAVHQSLPRFRSIHFPFFAPPSLPRCFLYFSAPGPPSLSSSARTRSTPVRGELKPLSARPPPLHRRRSEGETGASRKLRAEARRPESVYEWLRRIEIERGRKTEEVHDDRIAQPSSNRSTLALAHPTPPGRPFTRTTRTRNAPTLAI